MSKLKFTLWGWNDGANCQREFIIREVANVLNNFYKNEYINVYPLQICLRKNVMCNGDITHPCTHFDRSRICITTDEAYWCQFIFQFSHELCHCTTSRKNLPQNIKWFDEFICCFTSYFVLKQFENNSDVISRLYSNSMTTFSNYIKEITKGQIYTTQNTQEMFSEFYTDYLKHEDLIKQHDAYYTHFYEMMKGNFNGLSFIGKMHLVNTETVVDIVSYLEQLKKLCDKDETIKINMICDIFGISLAQEGQVA